MAQAPATNPAPVTEQAFMADREQFWHGFLSFSTNSVIGVVVLLILMAIFLV